MGALRQVDALIDATPDVAMSHRFKGETLFELNRYEDAIASFQTAEALGGPGTEELFFWRALAHANAGRRDVAVSILRSYLASPSAEHSMSQKCNAAIEAIEKAT